MIGGKIEDLKILIDYYGEDAKVVDVLENAQHFNIFDAQEPNWDKDLF